MGKKDVCVISRDPVPESMKFLPSSKTIKQQLPKKKFDVAIIIDCNEVARTGFDGFNAASLDSYNLTTIRQPVNQMAKAAIDILLERIENPDSPPEKRVLAGKFIRGNSARI